LSHIVNFSDSGAYFRLLFQFRLLFHIIGKCFIHVYTYVHVYR